MTHSHDTPRAQNESAANAAKGGDSSSAITETAAVDQQGQTPVDARALQRMQEKLVDRLRTRPTADGEIYVLDLRTEEFKPLASAYKGNRLTLRNPAAPEWPKQGATTSDHETAISWIKQRYAPMIAQQVAVSRSDPDKATMTVLDARNKLLEELEAEAVKAGQPRGTILPKDRSLMSMVDLHVVPKLGTRPLLSLDADLVYEAANSLKITEVDPETKQPVTRDAEDGTKRRFLSVTGRLFKTVFPTRIKPFAGAHVKRTKRVRVRSTEVSGFEDHAAFVKDETNGALEPSQLRRALAAAMYLDERNARRPNTRGKSIPNTAHAMAVGAAMGTRVSEEINFRYGHVFRTPKRHIRVHSAKSAHTNIEIRAVPTQRSLDPWLEDLESRDDVRALVAVRGHHNVFVLRTDPRAPLNQPGTTSTLGKRISEALKLAGLKVAKKATHGLRATFASICVRSPRIDGKTLAMYLGHDVVPEGTSTDVYLSQLLELMEEDHESIIQLPTPAEVREELERLRPEFDIAWRTNLGRKR